MGPGSSIPQVHTYGGLYRNFRLQTHWFVWGQRGLNACAGRVRVAMATVPPARERSLIAWLVFERAVITAPCSIMNTWLACQERRAELRRGHSGVRLVAAGTNLLAICVCQVCHFMHMYMLSEPITGNAVDSVWVCQERHGGHLSPNVKLKILIHNSGSR